jgi:hypothetical protein
VSWKGLRRKGTEILTSREWNTAVDALDELYGMLTTGQQDITVRDVYARSGNFSENVLVQGRPVIKDGDPVQIYMFYDIAVAQITKAIDEAKITEYARETRDVAVKIRMDVYGNVGVVIAEPLDVYGRVAVSAPSELLEEFKPVSAYGSITATENTAGFEVTLNKGGRPNVNIYFSLGGAGELYIEVSRDGANWRTLHYYSFTAAVSDVIVDTGVTYPFIRVRTPTVGIDVEFEIVASR